MVKCPLIRHHRGHNSGLKTEQCKHRALNHKTWTQFWTGLAWTGLDPVLRGCINASISHDLSVTTKPGLWTGLYSGQDWTGLDCVLSYNIAQNWCLLASAHQFRPQLKQVLYMQIPARKLVVQVVPPHFPRCKSACCPLELIL